MGRTNFRVRRTGGVRFGTFNAIQTETFGITVTADRVEEVTLAEWLVVLRSAEESIEKTIVITVEDKKTEKFVVLMRCEDRIGASVGLSCPHWDDAYVEAVLEKISSRSGDLLDEISYEFDEWVAGLLCNADTRRVGNLFELQELCGDVLRIPPNRRGAVGDLDVETLLRLIEVGGVDLLVGARESSWLEFKSQGYDLNSFASKIELSQDVCRFANGREAALLLLGFRTKKRDGIEAVEKVVPLAVQVRLEARYQAVLDSHVYPPVAGLEIKQIPVASGAVVAVCVPAQPDGQKPYLTYGAVVDGKNEGSFISIIERRGEGSRPRTVAEIHSLLIVGRSLLEGTGP